MKTPLPNYLTPVNILDDDAQEQIKRQGEMARREEAFNMICSVHGQFAVAQEANLEREEERHRNSLECYGMIRLERQ